MLAMPGTVKNGHQRAGFGISEGRQRKISTRVLRSRCQQYMIYIRKFFIMLSGLQNRAHGKLRKTATALTPSIAGSSGTCGCSGLFSFGVSSILRSLTSLPRNTMYSYTLSDGGTSSSGRRPSVPYEITCSSATVEFSELISCRVPT